MMEYHVMGKVWEERPTILVYSNNSYSIHKEPTIICYPFNSEEILRYLNYDNPMIFGEAMKVFKEYKECRVIKSDKEFNTGNIITYKNKDYVVTYKYNIELEQHELYIEYEVELIKTDKKTINECKSIYDSCIKYRAWRKNEQEKAVETVTNENKILNKLKSIFKRS